jgi:ZIP family zinc transporter
MHGLVRALPSPLLLALIGLATGAATYLGGALALRVKGHIRFILGFSAGAVIAVALFDLLPEAAQLSGGLPLEDMVGFAGIGFAAYMLLDRTLKHLSRKTAGHLGPASLTTHSFLDGLGIGLAFHVSAGAGLVLALAVLAHDFSDGVNTVSLSLTTSSAKTARGWLTADAIAPILGIALGQLAPIPAQPLALLLAGFAGAFLYIGASELAPESYQRHPHLWTSISTALGMAVIYGAVRLAG